MREYGKIKTAFWDHPEIKPLSLEVKGFISYFFTNKHGNALGCYHCPIGYISADLGISIETVSKLLKILQETTKKGLVWHDPDTDWLLIPEFLEHNEPENINVGKHIQKVFENVPKNFKYFNNLIIVLKEHTQSLPKKYRSEFIPLLNGYQTVSKQTRIPEPEPEPEPEPKHTPISTKSEDDECFYKSKKGRKLKGQQLEWFEKFWIAFNYKQGKAEAADAWVDAKVTQNVLPVIIGRATLEAKYRPLWEQRGRTSKMAQGWISGRRWEDEVKPPINLDNKQPVVTGEEQRRIDDHNRHIQKVAKKLNIKRDSDESVGDFSQRVLLVESRERSQPKERKVS